MKRTDLLFERVVHIPTHEDRTKVYRQGSKALREAFEGAVEYGGQITVIFLVRPKDNLLVVPPATEIPRLQVEALMRICNALGLTEGKRVRRLAIFLGVSPSTVTRLLRGERIITQVAIRELVEMCRFKKIMLPPEDLDLLRAIARP